LKSVQWLNLYYDTGLLFAKWKLDG
jgi:hypothetical protein